MSEAQGFKRHIGWLHIGVHPHRTTWGATYGVMVDHFQPWCLSLDCSWGQRRVQIVIGALPNQGPRKHAA